MASEIIEIPTSLADWHRLASVMVKRVCSSGFVEHDVQLRKVRQVRSVYTTNSKLSGSTLGSAELLLLRTFFLNNLGGIDYMSTLAHLKGASLLDDDSYSRGLELVGLDKNLKPIDRPTVSLSTSSERSSATTIKHPVAGANQKQALSSSPSKGTAASSSTSTPQKAQHAPPPTPAHPPAPQKATSRSNEKDYSRNAFPPLHAAIDAFALKGASGKETAGRLQFWIFPLQKDETPVGSLGSQSSISRFSQSDPDSPSYHRDRKGGLVAGSLQTAPIRIRQEEGHDNDDDNGDDDGDDDDGGRDADDNDEEDKVPRDETMITVFATSFFNAFSSFGTDKQPEHQMLPIREMFRCAPHTQLGLPDNFYYFKAAVDAVVPTVGLDPSVSHDENKFGNLFITEFKRQSFRRIQGTIEMQEAAEVAAFIASRQAARAVGQKGASQLNPHVLHLSQYNTDISLILAEYDDEWLSYLLNGSQFILADNTTLEDKHFLRMRRLGVFRVFIPQEMYMLVALLAGILTKDREVSVEGK